RIDEPHRVELVERGAVVGEMLRLPPHRRLPGNPEPREVLVDRGLVLGPAARRVDVLAAHQQGAVGGGGELGVEQGRTGMAEVEEAVRARREAEGGTHHRGYGLQLKRSMIFSENRSPPFGTMPYRHSFTRCRASNTPANPSGSCDFVRS